jgi:hypothetical protein
MTNDMAHDGYVYNNIRIFLFLQSPSRYILNTSHRINIQSHVIKERVYTVFEKNIQMLNLVSNYQVFKV